MIHREASGAQAGQSASPPTVKGKRACKTNTRTLEIRTRVGVNADGRKPRNQSTPRARQAERESVARGAKRGVLGLRPRSCETK